LAIGYSLAQTGNSSAILVFPRIHLGGLHPAKPEFSSRTQEKQAKSRRQETLPFTIYDFSIFPVLIRVHQRLLTIS